MKKFILVGTLIMVVFLIGCKTPEQLKEEEFNAKIDAYGRMSSYNWQVTHTHSTLQVTWKWLAVFNEQGNEIWMKINQDKYKEKTLSGKGRIINDELVIDITDSKNPNWKGELRIPLSSIGDRSWTGGLNLSNGSIWTTKASAE